MYHDYFNESIKNYIPWIDQYCKFFYVLIHQKLNSTRIFHRQMKDYRSSAIDENKTHFPAKAGVNSAIFAS